MISEETETSKRPRNTSILLSYRVNGQSHLGQPKGGPGLGAGGFVDQLLLRSEEVVLHRLDEVVLALAVALDELLLLHTLHEELLREQRQSHVLHQLRHELLTRHQFTTHPLHDRLKHLVTQTDPMTPAPTKTVDASSRPT